MNRLRETREEAGMSVAALARKARMSRMTINALESGERKGSLESWLKLANALNAPLGELSGQEYQTLATYAGKALAG